MSTVEASGIQAEQAEANAYRDASNDQELVTKKDLQVELAPIKVMVAVIMGGVIAIIINTFF